jgi:hypothetical protein
VTDLSIIQFFTRMTVALAETICGKLSHTTKMPCPSYSLPVARCVTGAKLARIPGSVCSKCYAKRGRHIFHTSNQETRWQSLTHPRWVEAITHLIREGANPHFRWHDSGDLAGHQHLQNIVDVALALPEVSFWLPTSEAGIVNKYQQTKGVFPANLTVRVSTTLIDSAPKPNQMHTSSVHKNKPAYGVACVAPQQGNKCLACRACWNKEIKNVSYKYH